MDIIDSFNKLTLGMYEDILAVSRDETLEDIDRTVRIISILTGASEDEVLHLPIAEFTELSARTAFLSAENFKAGRIARKYKVGDWELIPVTDYRKLETCQYIDFKTYAPDLENHMVEFLSVILVPKGHRYNEGYDILDVQKAIREGLSVTDGATIVGFFLTWCERSIKDSLHYSKEEAKKVKDRKKREELLKRIEEQETLLKTNGGGSTA